MSVQVVTSYMSSLSRTLLFRSLFADVELILPRFEYTANYVQAISIAVDLFILVSDFFAFKV